LKIERAIAKTTQIKKKIKAREPSTLGIINFKTPNKQNSYILSVLTKITIFIHQLRHLLLQPIVLFHQQLIHCSQLPIYSLQPRRLLSLLLSTSEQLTKTKQISYLDKPPPELHKPFISHSCSSSLALK